LFFAHFFVKRWIDLFEPREKNQQPILHISTLIVECISPAETLRLGDNLGSPHVEMATSWPCTHLFSRVFLFSISLWVAFTGFGLGVDILDTKAFVLVFFRLDLYFYRAMHFSAKRGIAIACRLSVRLSVCDVGEL